MIYRMFSGGRVETLNHEVETLHATSLQEYVTFSDSKFRFHLISVASGPLFCSFASGLLSLTLRKNTPKQSIWTGRPDKRRLMPQPVPT